MQIQAGGRKDLPGKESLILFQMITGGAVEGISQQGPDRGSQINQALFGMFDAIRKKTQFDRITPEDLQAGRTTRAVFTQLSAIDRKLVGEAASTDIALCLSFRAEDVLSDGTPGQMSAIVTIARDHYQDLYKLIANKPETVFALIRVANHGPIRAKDRTTPAKILPGDKLRIMPNTAIGGKLNQIVESQPFPPGFNPNPLF